MRYFVSDLHFGCDGIQNWERHRFHSIEEHDAFLLECLATWAKKFNKGDEFWILGDWGDVSYLPIMKTFRCKTVFLYGNHDFQVPVETFEEYFDEVHQYPVYLSQKLVVSHYPVAVYKDSLNIHGHLHGAHLKDPNHISVSINDIDYTPLSEKNLEKYWKAIPAYNRWFLWEPWTADMVINDLNRTDIIFNPKTGELDSSASRVLRNVLMNGEKPLDTK